MESGYRKSSMRALLGTFVAVEARTDVEEGAASAVAAAFTAVERVASLMHPNRPGSDLAALHACELHVPQPVDAWTLDVLELCLRLHRLTRGAFDPCLPERVGRMSDLELTAACEVVCHAPVSIDLGGIAKGFAVDRALDALRAAGCSGGLVNAGGDVAVFGDDSHAIVVRGAAGDDLLVELRDAALATSKAEHADRPPEHRGYYHGAGRHAVLCGTATVVAGSAAVADALATCLLIGDPESHEELLATFHARRIRNSTQDPDRSA